MAPTTVGSNETVANLPQICEFTFSLTACIRARPRGKRRTALAYSAFDVRYKDEWECALIASGWTRLSCAYRYQLDKALPRQTPIATSLKLYVYDSETFPTEILERIFPSIWSNSLDPFAPIRAISLGGYVADILAQGMSINTIVGFEGSDPVGLVIAGLAHGKEPTSVGWILDIGVVPIYRFRGYGAALLGQAVEQLRSKGAKQIFSVIDEANAPSLKLHRSYAFGLVDGPFLTFVL